MEIIFQVFAERVPLLRTITQSGHTNPRQFLRASRPVISTEAAHSPIVGRAVEKSASLPDLPPSHNRVITVARFRPHPNTEAVKKIYFKKEENFRRQESVRQAPRFTTQFTTTSPRFTIKKHHKNSKTPCKNHARPQKHFFRTHNPKTPPVRLDRCGLSSPSCSSPLSPWRRTLPQ